MKEQWEGDNHMVRLLSKFVTGLLFALLLGLPFYLLGSVLANELPNINLGGDKAGIIFGTFLGMPLGGLIGFLVVDKTIYKLETYNFLGLMVGFTASFFVGGIGSVLLLDIIGAKAIFLIPLLVMSFSLAGYQLGLKVRSKT